MTTTIELSHLHQFMPAATAGRAPILLLHGTGGDENDLVPLGQAIAPGAALLSPRGKVLEGGMPRFFRRLAEGVFDEADVRRRAGDLAGKPVLILSGAMDPIVPAENAAHLAAILERAGAAVDHRTLPAGHGLT